MRLLPSHSQHRIKMHEQRQTNTKREDVVPKGAVPAYLLDRCVKPHFGDSLASYSCMYVRRVNSAHPFPSRSNLLSSLFLPYPSSSSSREGQSRAKVLSNMVKQKRKEKAVGDLIFDLFNQVSTSVSVRIFM